jgi:DNA repair exonuclease SbcCD nuclease subunit
MSKALLFGDSHLGIGYPNKHQQWSKISKDYIDLFAIPQAKRLLTQDDVIIQMGDLFDNRNVIPVDTLCLADYFLEELSKICPVHMIVGNHDLWSKSYSDINTPRIFRHMNNVSVYSEDAKVNIGGVDVAFVPYVEKSKDQIAIIKKYTDCSYLFCHSDLNGAKMHLTSIAHKNKDKINVDEFACFKHVYSGHIHIRQQSKNFTFVGSAYEMDRNDYLNHKGIWLLDLPTGDAEFIPNDVSPKFNKVIIKTEDDIEQLDGLDMNDFNDLFISTSLVSSRKVKRKLEAKLETGNFSDIIYVDDISSVSVGLSIEEETQRIIEQIEKNISDGESLISIDAEYTTIISEYINSLEFENDSIKQGVKEAYSKIIETHSRID